MKKLTEFSVRFPWLVILTLAAITIFFGLQIPKIRIDNELTTFLPEDDPAKQFYNDVEDVFGSEILAVIGVFVKEGGPYKDVFDPAILTMISDMTQELEASSIPAKVNIREKVRQPDGSEAWQVVRTEEEDLSPDDVVSLATMSHVASRTIPAEQEGEEAEEMIEVVDVLGEAPGAREDRIKAVEKGVTYRNLPADLLYSKETADQARHILNGWEMYKNNLVSENFSSTALYVTIPRRAQIEYETDLHEFIEAMVARYNRMDDGVEFHIAGLPMIAVLLGQYMRTDLARLVPLCFLVMIGMLILSFRRFNGVVLPCLTVSMAVIWTVGLMALVGKAMTIITNGLPVLMVAVGSAYTIHVVHHFYERIALGTPKKEAIVSTMSKIGMAVLMAGLTTVGGFGSLASSQVVPIRDFGIFAAFGAFSALVINFLILPAILSVQPHPGGRKPIQVISPEEELAIAEKSMLGKGLGALAATVARHPKLITGVSLAVLAVFAGFSTQVLTNSDMVRYFRTSSPIRVSDGYLNRMLGGTTTFSVVIDSKEVEGFMKPENLRKIEDFQKFLHERFPNYLKKTMSIVDYLKKINKTIGKEQEDQYRIPETEEEVFDDLMLYESRPEALESVIDFDRRRVRVLVRSQVGGTRYMNEMKPVIEQYAAEHMPGFDVNLTGEMLLRWTTDRNIVRGQKLSIILSLAAVFILLIIIFKSLRLGLVGMGPIVISILGNFTLMVILGYDLDVGTALIASTAVGIGIDYAIHYVNRYRIERKSGFAVAEAVRRTHVTTGKAIIFNAAAVALGFLVMMGSQFIPLIRLGTLTAAVMFLAAFTSLSTLPALLVLIRPYRNKQNGNHSHSNDKEIAS